MRRRARRIGGPAWLDTETSSATSQRSRSPGDLRPPLLPCVVVHAVVAWLPTALGDGRLPELDLVVVRGGLVEVVLRARALLQLVHVRARLRVDGRLAEHARL